MEANSFEEVNIDSVVLINPHLHCGVNHKGDCGVDKIPLVNLYTLVVHGVSYHSLSVESLICIPLVLLGNKLIVTLVGVGII